MVKLPNEPGHGGLIFSVSGAEGVEVLRLSVLEVIGGKPGVIPLNTVRWR